MISVILFAIAAVGGATLATLRLRQKQLPMALALGHGALAAAGLVTLILLVLRNGDAGSYRLSLVLFLVAALGGFFLFSLHLRNKELPIPVVLIHGLVAVSAFVILLLAVTGVW